MVGPCVPLTALGAVVSGILAAPPSARAQSMAALSAVGFPIVGASSAEISSLRPAGGTAVPVSARDTAVALSQAGLWSTAGVVVTGTVATLVLRDSVGAVQASLVVPARAVAAAGLRAGDAVRTTGSEAGTILHKDGRVLAFVAGDDQRNPAQRHAPVAH